MVACLVVGWLVGWLVGLGWLVAQMQIIQCFVGWLHGGSDPADGYFDIHRPALR